MPGRDTRDGQCRRLRVGQRPRRCRRLVFVNDDVIRKHAAIDRPAHGEYILPVVQVATAPAWKKHRRYSVTEPEARHLGPTRDDHTDAVGNRNNRTRGPPTGIPFDDQKIAVVQ